MENAPHLERFIGKDHEKQIMSARGTPVKIRENPEALGHTDKVTLGVGGLIKMREIRTPIVEEEEALQRDLARLTKDLERDAIAHIRTTNPDFASQYPLFTYGEYPLVETAMEQILEENPERRTEIERAQALLRATQARRYQFGDAEKDELYVGKEGTLIYSLQSGDAVADELRKVYFLHDQQDMKQRVAQLRERLSTAKSIADIHQVEVLAEFQGKGIASALIDVALWDIEKTRHGIAFSIARILDNNPDGSKMVAAFKKAGFEAYRISSISWDDPRSYTLVIRENSP